MKILVIEDEMDIRKLLRAYLEKEGFQVDETNNGSRGLLMHAQNVYDLIILDIMIPEVDGWSVCEKIRKTSNVPIIMVTAKSADSDKILGLELGADDYLVKPFSPKELIARIKALFRRIKIHQPAPALRPEPLVLGKLKIDTELRAVFWDDNNVALTPKEFAILYTIAYNRHKVYDRNELLLEVWGDQYTDTRAVDTHVKTIREKFRKGGFSGQIIETVWGLGYKLAGDVENV